MVYLRTYFLCQKIPIDSSVRLLFSFKSMAFIISYGFLLNACFNTCRKYFAIFIGPLYADSTGLSW